MSFKVIGVGEVLWDLLPDGPQLGGAPANFAYHAHALGARAVMVTRVGRDELGRRVLARFQEMGLATSTLQVDDQAPTGTVTVTLTGQGVPEFVIHQDVAWDRLILTQPARDEARDAHAICFGSLGQRSPTARAAIQGLVATTPASALRVFDINLRQQFYSHEVIEQSLRLANVLKLNESELPVLADLFELGGSEQKQIDWLAGEFELRLVALTRGARGSLLYQAGRWSEQPSQPVEVVDTVGAGDAFTAGLVVGLLNGMDLDELHSAAAEVARYVCACAGATPPLTPDLRNKFHLSRSRAVPADRTWASTPKPDL